MNWLIISSIKINPPRPAKVFTTAAITSFEGYPTCPEWSNRLALYECNLPLTPWTNGHIDLAVDVQCGRPGVFGPLDNESMNIGSLAAFEVESDAVYSIEVSSDVASFAGVRITRCGSCWDELDLGVVAGGSEDSLLPAGRYYATFVAEVSSPGTIELRIAPSP